MLVRYHFGGCPERRLASLADMAAFPESRAYGVLVRFITELSDSVKALPISREAQLGKASPAIRECLNLLDHVNRLVDATPPSDDPTRFGNLAFRKFYDQLNGEAEPLLAQMLSHFLSSNKAGGEGTAAPPSEFPGSDAEGVEWSENDIANLSIELAAYLTGSFGDRMRIDFGSGHELNFIAFLLCLRRLRILKKEDFANVVTLVFARYLEVACRIQETYKQEPAGSRGVWGLDDFHFLPFLFGAAQLVGQSEIQPRDVVKEDVARNYGDEYLYLNGMRRIFRTKAGVPLGECNPMLNDIAAVPTWSKIHKGMIKMYEAEVLEKLPVMQHFLFGFLIPYNDHPV